MKVFTFQNWIKWESEGLIINALFEGDKRFNQLQKYTQLSNPVLAKRLKELEKKKRINAVPDSKTKRFFYSLNRKKINSVDEERKKTENKSRIKINEFIKIAKDQTVSDEKYLEELNEVLKTLLDYRLDLYFKAPLEFREEWLKINFGLEFTKNLTDIFPENRTKSILQESFSKT